MKNEDIRWKQRFHNFSRAFTLLREYMESDVDVMSLEPIVREGIIQRFSYTYELAWKTLKDKMEYDGLVLDKISPKYVFKAAYQNKYIDNVEVWLNMANDRNLMSHTYNFETFNTILKSVKEHYFSAINALYDDLIVELLEISE